MSYILCKAQATKEMNECLLNTVTEQIEIVKMEMDGCYNQFDYDNYKVEMRQYKAIKKVASIALEQVNEFIKENQFYLN